MSGLLAIAVGLVVVYAAASLAEAYDMYHSDVQVLNALGMAYYRLGQVAKALEAWKASLKLNPAQDEIKKLVAGIGKQV